MDDRTERPTIKQVAAALDAYEDMACRVTVLVIRGQDVPADLVEKARAARDAWLALSTAHHASHRVKS